MRVFLATLLFVFVGADVNGQTPNAANSLAQEWEVTLVETVPLPPLQISRPTLKVVEDRITGAARVELTVLAKNLTDKPITTPMSVWVHEFTQDGSWFFDGLNLTAPEYLIAPAEEVLLRFPYRDEFDGRVGTRLMLSLKSARVGNDVWEQADPIKRTVAVMRGQASPRLADMPYDEFMNLLGHERKAVFNYVPADAKARLMRTHLQRYLGMGGDTLTLEQRALLEDAIAQLNADTYAVPRPQVAERRMRDLVDRARRLFTAVEAAQLFTLEGPPIPDR